MRWKRKSDGLWVRKRFEIHPDTAKIREQGYDFDVVSVDPGIMLDDQPLVILVERVREGQVTIGQVG